MKFEHPVQRFHMGLFCLDHVLYFELICHWSFQEGPSGPVSALHGTVLSTRESWEVLINEIVF